MNGNVAKLLLVLVLGAAGVVILVRALQGGGPVYYFVSAICLGMALAALQSRGGASGGRAAGGNRKGNGAGTKDGRGR